MQAASEFNNQLFSQKLPKTNSWYHNLTKKRDLKKTKGTRELLGKIWGLQLRLKLK